MLSLDGNEFISYKGLELLILLFMLHLYCKKNLYAEHSQRFSKERIYKVLEYKYYEKKDMQNAFLVSDNTHNLVWITDSIFWGHFKFFSLVIDTTSSSNGNKND